MKKLSIILLAASTVTCCMETDPARATQPQPITSETHNTLQLPEGVKTLHIHNQNTVENNNMPKFLVQVWNSTNMTVTTILMRAQEKINSNVQWLMDTLTKHKKIVGIGAGVSAYASLCGYIYYLQRLVYTSDSWSAWKSHIPLEVLLNSPQDEIAKELVIEIQKNYTTTEQLADFISPLVKFINTITHEKKQLERYLFMQKWLRRLYLHILFPHDEIAFQKAQEKVDRLSYLKHLLISWISEYKIQTNNTKQKEDDEVE